MYSTPKQAVGVGELAHGRTAAKLRVRLNELIVQVWKVIMQLQTRTKQGHAGRWWEEGSGGGHVHDREGGREGGRKREGVNMWYYI